jgi:hypothetical protein
MATNFLKVPVFSANVYDSEIGWLPRANAYGWNQESGRFIKKGPGGWNDLDIGKTGNPGCTFNFFGDSFVEGAQYPAEYTFSEKSRNEISGFSKCERVLVNNFGVSGTGTLQQARILERLGTQHQAANSALFIFLGNDLQNNLYSDGLAPGFDVSSGAEQIVGPNKRGKFSRLRELVAPITDHSAFMRLVTNIVTGNNRLLIRDKSSAASPINEDPQRGITINEENYSRSIYAFRQSLELTSKMANSVHTELSYFLIPTGQEIAFGDTPFVNAVKSIFFDWCEQNNHKCVDAYPQLRARNKLEKNSQFHISVDGHLNELGHEQVSRIVSDHFRNNQIK